MAAAKIGERCTVRGCKKRMAPDTDMCAKHLKLALRDKVALVRTRIELPVLTALCAAVSAKYKEEGDKIKAGVVVACLSHDPPRYYASVARYPDSPHHKQVVCKVGHTEPISTAEQAVVDLAHKWSADNQPAPVREALETLAEVLRG